AFIIAVVGNLVPIPVLVVFTRKVFEWLRTISNGLDRFVSRLEAKAEKNKEVVQKYEFWGLVLLVAIPLPGTGAWTGALVAAMMDMRLKRAMPAIILGVLIAGVIVTTVTYGAGALF
ncbi:MAG: small multi-drug export protein, partial [Mogibacterium sp.]|nr:small multi-drug export protein [Mogibacterium sp.]